MNPYELAANLESTNEGSGYLEVLAQDAAKEIRKLCTENTTLFDFLHSTDKYGLYLAYKALIAAGETELAKTL